MMKHITILNKKFLNIKLLFILLLLSSCNRDINMYNRTINHETVYWVEIIGFNSNISKDDTIFFTNKFMNICSDSVCSYLILPSKNYKLAKLRLYQTHHKYVHSKLRIVKYKGFIKIKEYEILNSKYTRPIITNNKII